MSFNALNSHITFQKRRIAELNRSVSSGMSLGRGGGSCGRCILSRPNHALVNRRQIAKIKVDLKMRERVRRLILRLLNSVGLLSMPSLRGLKLTAKERYLLAIIRSKKEQFFNMVLLQHEKSRLASLKYMKELGSGRYRDSYAEERIYDRSLELKDRLVNETMHTMREILKRGRDMNVSDKNPSIT